MEKEKYSKDQIREMIPRDLIEMSSKDVRNISSKLMKPETKRQWAIEYITRVAEEDVPNNFTYKNSSTKMNVICCSDRHDESKPRIYPVRMTNFKGRHSRCPKCANGWKRREARLLSWEDVVVPNMNVDGYTLLSEKNDYNGNDSPLYVMCPEGDKYYTTYDNFRGSKNRPGRRCAKCNYNNKKGIRYDVTSLEEYFEKLKEKCTERGGKDIYVTEDIKYVYNKVIFTCTFHPTIEFELTIPDYIEREGCTGCLDIIRKNGIIKEFEDKYGKDAFDLQHLPDNIKQLDHARIICMRCEHDFCSRINDILSEKAKGCPKCVLKARTSTREEFIEKAINKHGDSYNYDLVKYITNRIHVTLTCKKCKKSFPVTPDNHLNGSGCPFCNFSKGEKAITNFLDENKIEYDTQHRTYIGKGPKPKRFDFYLQDRDIYIEFQGIQHYEPVTIFDGITGFIKRIKYDIMKIIYVLKKNGILLLTPSQEHFHENFAEFLRNNSNEEIKHASYMSIMLHLDKVSTSFETYVIPKTTKKKGKNIFKKNMRYALDILRRRITEYNENIGKNTPFGRILNM